MKRLLFIPLVALISLPLLAGDRPDSNSVAGANVLYTLKVVDSGAEGSVPQSVRALALTGEPTRLNSGWRIPIPVKTASAAEGIPTSAMTTIQYEEVGLSASLDGDLLPGRRVRVGGGVELSAVSTDHASVPGTRGAPRVGTVSHRFRVVLDSGEETLLAEIPRPDGSVLTLTLLAEVQN